MSDKSAVLAAVLLFAFFVFITTRGELLDYLGTVGLGPRADQWKAKQQAASSSDSGGFSLSDVANLAANAAKFAAMAG